MSQNIHFGLRAGMGLSNIKQENAPKGYYNMTVNYHGGAFVHMKLGNAFSVEPGLQLSIKGTQYEQQVEIYNVTTTENLLYLDIPVLLRVMPHPKFDFFVGPQASVFIHQTTQYEVEDQRETEINTLDIKTLDMGLVMGGAFYIQDQFQIQASYDLGMTSIIDIEESSIQNRVFKLSFAYIF